MILNPTMDDIIRHLNNHDYVTAKALIIDCCNRNGIGKITEELMESIIIPLLENNYFNPINHTVTVTVKFFPPEEQPVPVNDPPRQKTMDFPIAKNPKKGKHPNQIGPRLCLSEEKQKEFVIDWQIHGLTMCQLVDKYNITKQTVKNYMHRYWKGHILIGWKPSKNKQKK